ncbi:MAG TPA: tetratricopeptide repeat protein [Blastocatellia bacterium]|nr:tetratricopeptide repeat protein [Blastocatellia bacterium]
MVSSTISHYRIVKRLGAGGMGEVFLAEDMKLARKVAIKLLPTESIGDDQARRRLIREAKAAAILDHANICAVYEVNEENNCTFIVMQYVEGETLASRITDHPLSTEEAIDIAAQVAEALAEAHSHGVIHRDIKPQNIILTARRRVKVLDFGLAKIVQQGEALDSSAITQSQFTDTGRIAGTPAYMSPERLRGEPADPRSDLFSLGVVLYECCTGRSPFPGINQMDVCASVVHVDPPPPSQLNPSVPPELDAITMKALAKKAETRYQSATEMQADLLKLREVSHASDEPRTPISWLKARSLRLRISAGLSTALRPRASITFGLVTVPLVVVLAILLPPRFWHAGPHQPLAEAKGWYERGAAALRDGAYYQASKMLEKSVELDDKFALAHARLAEAYTEIDYTDRAKDEVMRAGYLVPDRAVLSEEDANYLSAITATVMRDSTTAVEHYRKISELATDQEKPSVYVDLGRSYEKNEDLDKAMESYQEAIRRDPQSGAAFLRLGILYGRKQNLRNATEAFEKAEAIYQTLTNTEGVAEVRYQRGTLLNTMGRLEEAHAELQRALDVTQTPSKNDYQQIKIRILLQLSNVSYNAGETAQAREYANQGIEIAQANGIEALATDGLIDLGNTFLFRGEFDEAEKYLKQALDFARRGKAHRTEARAILQLGSLNVQRDNPDEGIPLIEKALTFYQPRGYNKETSRALVLLGRAHCQKGDYETALQILERQLQLARDLGDQSEVASSHQSIGILLVEYQERYPEALAHFDESCGINERIGRKSNLGFDLMNRGTMLWQLGHYDEAGKVLPRALSIADSREAGNKELVAWVYLSDAQMALSKRHFAEARTKSQQALHLARTQFKELEIRANSTLGLVSALSGTPREGKELCERAVTSARDSGIPKLLSDTLLSLAEALVESRDSQNGLRIALEAQARFEHSAQLDSEWRAWLIAARASQLAADESAMHDQASRAAGVLSNIQQWWGADAYAIYAARPDVQIYRRQIEQMLTVSK